MQQNEQEAHQLVDNLTKLGISANVEGAGVHWRVDVSPINNRSLHVHCFWYERHISGLMLGMNPANSRSQLKGQREPYEGHQFYVIVNEFGKPVENGRTYIADEAITCIRSWISGDSLESLIQKAPFIGKKRRAIKVIAMGLDPRLRWEMDGDPSFDLWVYGSGRSCRVRDETCAFFVGQVQVAFAQKLPDAPSHIAAWLIDEVPLISLASQAIELERHAEVLQVDPAHWHWLHVRDRIANPDDVLFDLAPLIVRLSENPVVSQFYTYSSLNRLCFSASSHYPWVGKYPVVWAINSNKYRVSNVTCALEEAIDMIETALAASPIQPFFGSEPEYEIHLIAKALERQESLLRPKIIQRKQWSDIWLSKDSRRCRLDTRSITCFEGTAELRIRCGNVDDVVGIAIRFLENAAGFDDLRSNPR